MPNDSNHTLLPHALAETASPFGIELEKDAQVAVQLVDLLEERFDPKRGVWNAESLVKTVSNTCQAVEALTLLERGDISQRLVAPALDWLLHLELADALSEDDQRAVRIFPSRFKTLAALQRFERGKLHADFQELGDCLDESQGWMLNVPTEMRPELVTMIWLDTLWYLEQGGWDISAWHTQQRSALTALMQAFDDWLAPPRPYKKRDAHLQKRVGINQDGDASYALDLFLRSGSLRPDSPRAQATAAKLAQAFPARRPGDLRESDLIYCGIQLSIHFPQDRAARAAVRAFINELREGYARQAYGKHPISFHALVLRLLASFHRVPLRDEIQRWHWTLRRQAQAQHKEDAAARQRRELEKLLQTTFQIQIGKIEHLSGSRSRTEVIRVCFGFKTAATNMEGDHIWHGDQALRLIVKRGNVEALTRAIEGYNNLLPELQPYFAHHAASVPPPLSDDPAQPWYLLMQDLAQTKPLSEVLDEIDQAPRGAEQREWIARCVKAVSGALQALHRSYRRQVGVTNQVERLYIQPITEGLDLLCDPANYLTLKPYVVEGFSANGRSYRRLMVYLNALKAYETKLRPPILCKIHGDAHSRNIMLTTDLRGAKFVDVESLRENEDYIADYALLLEDVAFYCLLPSKDPRQRIGADELSGAVAGDQSLTNTENRIDYPAFPKNSEMALEFQRALIAELSAFAETLGDPHWQKRLWLAIAKSLILLVTRQASGERLRNLSQRDALNIVLVTFAEVVRLLDELLRSLEGGGGQTLPEIPFRGVPDVLRGNTSRTRVREIIQLFKQLPDVTVKHAPDAPAWIHYSVGAEAEPFAEFRTSEKSGEIALYLFAPRNHLGDPHHLISGHSEDKHAWIIRKPELNDTPGVGAVIQAAYRWACSRGRARV